MSNVVNNGSHLSATPPLQHLDHAEARDITKEVRDVYKVEKKSDNWKAMAFNAFVLIAAGVAILALGILHMPALIGIGAALLGYGIYQAYEAIQKGRAHKAILKVHDDATVHRLSSKVQENQAARQTQRGQAVQMSSFPPIHGYSQPYFPQTAADAFNA